MRTLKAGMLCIGLVGWISCSSPGHLKKVELDSKLPQDVPPEFLEKFEVKELGQSRLAPAPIPLAQKGSKKKKGKKSELKSTPAPASDSGSFAYPSRRPAKDPLRVGEQLVFEITYFGMAAGDFTLSVLPYKEISGRRVYHLQGTAISSKVFSLFYRINDMIESFVDYEGWFSHRFHMLLDETKQTRDSLEMFDSEKKQMFFWNRHNHHESGYSEKKEYADMQPFPQDSLSALYYIRTQPLKTDDVFDIPIASEAKTWTAQVTVLRREWIQSPLGRVQAIVVRPENKYQGVLKKEGESYIWLSDDERRYPLRLEAKVKIGTVVAVLKKVEPGND